MSSKYIPMSGSRLSPERDALLQRIIDDLDTLYTGAARDQDEIETFLMSKISTALGDLMFVQRATKRTAKAVAS